MHTFISNKKEGNNVFLSKTEATHCAKVLRMKTNQVIRIVDGKGNGYEGKLIKVSEQECIAEIINTEKEEKKKYFLQIAIAPTKNIDRTEWFVEKAVELGVDKISFVVCTNSERKIIKNERVVKIIESAVKQSKRFSIPESEEAVDFKNFVLSTTNFSGIKLISHCRKTNKKKLNTEFLSREKLLFLIGPEGDFTEDEIKFATDNNFISISLGNNTLRTETAGVFIAAVINTLV